MWDGPMRPVEPFVGIVQTDWEFHNPFGLDPIIHFAKGEAAVMSFLIPARHNDPFGFPFIWGENGKPYPLWLIERRDDS